jgi:crossover junction endodeoxyribonuclease RuvC
MRYVGIDVGITGAVAVLDKGFVQLYDIPTREVGGNAKVKREVDGPALARMLEYLPIQKTRVLIERTNAMPGQGVASMFSMGVSRGVVLGVLGCLALPYAEVTPQKWKKAFGLVKAPKSESIRLAIELYPAAAQWLTRAKDHNRAEAILLAHYSMGAK